MASPFAARWSLEPGLDFLNHGSFGATPRVVLEAQQAWRDRMERDPVRFLARDLEGLLDAARAPLAEFLAADSSDLAFVPNATAGLNTVLRSLAFSAGDELLTTDHAYNAARTALDAVAVRSGARVIVASVPFPVAHPDDAVAAVLGAVTPRTRLAVIDHVTSATAIVFPIARVVAELEERGAETLVDGAHAPGMLDLNVPGLGAAYYTGNLHKWVCAPKGSAFLWVRRDRQAAIRPLAISHGANAPRTDRSRFQLEFDWTGTTDPTAWLAVPEALRFGASLLPGGWPALRERNHALALQARDLLCQATGEPSPVPDAMVGCMASVPLPGVEAGGDVLGADRYEDPLHLWLLERDIQVATSSWPQRPDGRPWRHLVRVSAAAYNDRVQMEHLAGAVGDYLAAREPSVPTGGSVPA